MFNPSSKYVDLFLEVLEIIIFNTIIKFDGNIFEKYWAYLGIVMYRPLFPIYH